MKREREAEIKLSKRMNDAAFAFRYQSKLLPPLKLRKRQQIKSGMKESSGMESKTKIKQNKNKAGLSSHSNPIFF